MSSWRARTSAHTSIPLRSGIHRSSTSTSGAQLAGERERLLAAGGEPDDLDRRIAREQRRGPLAHQAMVVGDQHADGPGRLHGDRSMVGAAHA